MVLSKIDARRRIRAAMELADIGSIEELAERINQPGLAARTLRTITDPSDPRQTRPHEYEAIARVTGVPVEFLTSDDLFPPPGDARFDALSAAMAAHDQHMTALYADIVRRVDQLEGMVSGLRAVASTPAPGGELGRRLEEHQTTSRDPGAHDSHPGTDVQRGTGR